MLAHKVDVVRRALATNQPGRDPLAVLRTVGGFDPRFRYYRNADLDLSFAVRDAAGRAVNVASAWQTNVLPSKAVATP